MGTEHLPTLRSGSRLTTGLLVISLFVPTLLYRYRSAQERVYFGNLHSHTRYSDGTGTPRQAFIYARDVAKVDFLALTEHNHLKAMGPDGIGIAAEDQRTAGLGLKATAERIAQMGGQLMIAPGDDDGGTVMRAWVPL